MIFTSVCRICDEILTDLPNTYELNQEGTEWVARMMTYTVAGGKMNRGLATLSVRNTFAKLIGHHLTNKVAAPPVVSVSHHTIHPPIVPYRSAARPPRWAGASSSCRPSSWWPTI
jgi:hypothetical protein